MVIAAPAGAVHTVKVGQLPSLAVSKMSTGTQSHNFVVCKFWDLIQTGLLRQNMLPWFRLENSDMIGRPLLSRVMLSKETMSIWLASLGYQPSVRLAHPA